MQRRRSRQWRHRLQFGRLRDHCKRGRQALLTQAGCAAEDASTWKASGRIPEWAGQRVGRTNARGRNSYGEPFKAWVIEQALRPGMSTAGPAMCDRVNANLLCRWVQMHRRNADKVKVAPKVLAVTVAPEPLKETALIQPPPCIEIEQGCAAMRMRRGLDAEVLRTVNDALRDAAR